MKLSLGINSIWYSNYFKKNYQEMKKIYRKNCQNRPIVYIDEAGGDNRLYREYGQAPRGEKIHALAKDESIIGSWIGGRFQ